MRELHLHELPWPKAVLAEMGETPVRLRVTLSYFIEPNPGRRGWKTRHRYASHGLRFDMKLPTESADEFHKRLNQKALEEDEGKPTATGGLADWFIGEARNKGSLHSDIWVGTAADLAERGIASDQATAQLKLHPFVARKTAEQARNFSLPQLEAIYQKLLDTDIAIKTGRHEPMLALDLLVVELTS